MRDIVCNPKAALRTSLNLSGDPKLGAAGVYPFANGLANPDCTLKELSLSHCDLYGDAVAPFTTELLKSMLAKRLERSFNCINKRGCDGLLGACGGCNQPLLDLHRHAGRHGLHPPGARLQTRWLPGSLCDPDGCGCAQRPQGPLYGAGRGLGLDCGVHFLLRGLPGPDPGHYGLRGRPRLQAADLLGPGSEDEEAELGACKRPPCHDGVHRHVLP
jgi:hypothetical protein